MVLRILQLVGSPTNGFYAELSELYARGCIEALHPAGLYEFPIAHVSPDGRWRFPDALTKRAIDAAETLDLPSALMRLRTMKIDAAIPQMFCERGVGEYRALLDLLELPYLGNRPLQMALSADKTKTKAIVMAAGVKSPRFERLARGQRPTLTPPLVVKPNSSDNSDGITLVRKERDLPQALEEAWKYSDFALVEAYVELGREVRCGVVAHGSQMVALPLEEYDVDRTIRPVRLRADKLKRDDGETLSLAAKTATKSWIVDEKDAIVEAVQDAALKSYAALGLRHYGLFDFRIDPDGTPWFLEAGPYCSFSPQSVVATMMQAAGTPLDRFFADALEHWIGCSNTD